MDGKFDDATRDIYPVGKDIIHWASLKYLRRKVPRSLNDGFEALVVEKELALFLLGHDM
jgi:hypothetical protein